MTNRKYILLAAVLAATTTLAEESQVEVEPMISGRHQSDILRGSFFRPPEGGEPTNDQVVGGVTLTRNHFQVDLTVGVRTVDCTGISACDWTPSAEAALRYYPWDDTPDRLLPYVGGHFQVDLTDLSAPTNGYAAFGVSFIAGDRFEVDVSHGVKVIESETYEDGSQSGTEIAVRFYPFGRK